LNFYFLFKKKAESKEDEQNGTIKTEIVYNLKDFLLYIGAQFNKKIDKEKSEVKRLISYYLY